jgi:flagellar biosynthesis protein FliR
VPEELSALLPGTATLSAFLLVLTRTTAWVVTAPVISARGVASPGRLAVGVALALFLTPLVPVGTIPTDLPGFATLVIAQAGIGLLLGFLTGLLFSAFEVAGTLIDLAGGFSFSSLVDPLTGQPAAAFSRLFSLCFGAVLFATEGYRVIIGGFVASFRVMPLDELPALSEASAGVVGHAATTVVGAALMVAAPLLWVLFLTDVALALAARFVPQANTLSVALPVKTLIALTAGGATLALLPGHAAGLIEPALRLPSEVLV